MSAPLFVQPRRLGQPRRFGQPRRSVLVCIVSAAGIAGFTACGDSAEPDRATSTTEVSRRINQEEASTLADVLKNNFDDGGARFRATIPLGSSTVSVDGRVDWQGGRGEATVTADTAGAQASTVAFTATSVIEKVPGLADALAAQGLPPLEYAARPLDLNAVPLDFVLTLAASAASDQRDNPVTLAQQATWTGTETIGGIETHVFRLERTRYWVDLDEPRLLRLEADREGSMVVTVDFSDWGPTPVDLPPDGEVADATKIADVLASLRPQSTTPTSEDLDE